LDSSYLIYVLVYLLTIFLALSETLPVSVSALVGALFMAWFGINGGLFTYEEAFSFIDLKLTILLLGIMIVVEVASRSGIFRLISLYTTKLVGNSPRKLFITLCFLSAAASLFLSDIAAFLMVSATAVTISKFLGYDPRPFLISAALMINLGGTGVLIGSVSNMIIGLNAGMSFTEFAEYLLPCELSLWVLTTAILYFYFRDRLQGTPREIQYDVWASIEDRGAVFRSALILGALIIFFVMGDTIGAPTEAVAIGCAVIALATSGYDPRDVFSRLDWETIFFVIGFLFVVRGLERTGVLQEFSSWIMGLASGSVLIITVLMLFLSGIVSIFLANIAVALTFVPTVKLLDVANKKPIWSALVLGTNLGGATMPVSSVVLVMALGVLKQEGISIDLGEVTRIGFITSMIQMVYAAIYLIFYFRLVI